MRLAIVPLALLLVVSSAARSQPTDDGLPGAPRLPSATSTPTAPAAPSTSQFVGRWILRGFTTVVAGEERPTVVRLNIREAEGGGVSVERSWEVTQPDGTERRSFASTCDVRITGDVLEATFVLVDQPTSGIAGAVAGSAARPEVRNEVTWRLSVGPGGAGEYTDNATRLAPEHLWRSSTATGLRLQVQDLTSAAVTTLVNSGPSADRYDITFVSDGYTVADMPAYRRHVRDAVARLRATSPFREYWGYINIHKVEVISPGPGVQGGRGGPSALGTRIPTGVPSSERIPSGDGSLVKKAAGRAPGADAIVVLCFDPFRSVARGEYTLVSTWEDDHPFTTVHELGHVIGLLLDEYNEDEPSTWDFVSANAFVEEVTSWSGWGRNVTTHTSPGAVPWRHWLPAGVPVPTPAASNHPVGVYRGAYHKDRLWHRPSPSCLMRQTDKPFCVVCREQMILKLSEKTFPIQIKKEQLDEDTVRLSVTTTIPGEHRILWRRGNGQLMHGGPSVVARRKDLSWGDTTLWLQVEDRTPWVRNDHLGTTTKDVTFVLRKGLVWDRGLECVGPIRGRPSGGDSYGGASTGWDPNGFPRF